MAHPKLPLEVILTILDQLVGSSLEQQPIYEPSHPVTKTLRALTLTSRTVYPVASKYLYRRCLYLNDCVSYACFSRTMGIGLGRNHPQTLAYRQEPRLDALWDDTELPRYIKSIFISPMGMSSTETQRARYTPLVRLPQIVELCSTIGPTLRRMILDMQPVYSPPSEMGNVKLSQGKTKMLLGLTNLEELVISYDVLDYFHLPPPNLKKLAITIQEFHEVAMKFCFAFSTLQSLVMLRPEELSAAEIESIFKAYKGKSLDIVFVDVNSNHRTPQHTRDWTEEDTIRIWEADVPTSFYGDDDNLILCDNWIWTHAVKGTLWNQEKRRMVPWSEIQRRLAGPIHQIVD